MASSPSSMPVCPAAGLLYQQGRLKQRRFWNHCYISFDMHHCVVAIFHAPVWLFLSAERPLLLAESGIFLLLFDTDIPTAFTILIQTLDSAYFLPDRLPGRPCLYKGCFQFSQFGFSQPVRNLRFSSQQGRAGAARVSPMSYCEAWIK